MGRAHHADPGPGVGTLDFAKNDFGPSQNQFNIDDPTITQFIVRLGWPILLLFDVHLSYHRIQAEGKVSIPQSLGGGSTTVDLDATMIALGGKIGF